MWDTTDGPVREDYLDRETKDADHSGYEDVLLARVADIRAQQARIAERIDALRHYLEIEVREYTRVVRVLTEAQGDLARHRGEDLE